MPTTDSWERWSCSNAAALEQVLSMAANTATTRQHRLWILLDNGSDRREQFIIKIKLSCFGIASRLFLMLPATLSPAKAARNECALPSSCGKAATSCTLATLRAPIRQDIQPSSSLVDAASPGGTSSWICPVTISGDHRSRQNASFACYFLVEKIMVLGTLLPIGILFSRLRLIMVRQN